MIVKTNFRGFGATGITGADCPVGGDWDAWCECMYPYTADGALNVKCKSKPMSFLTLAPWTDVGAIQRGLPKANSPITAAAALLFPGQGSQVQPTMQPLTQPAAAEGIMGIPKGLMWLGGAVLATGIGALVITRKR